MKKQKIKWYQPNAVTARQPENDRKPPDFIKSEPPAPPEQPQTDQLRQKLRSDVQQFKRRGLYREALAALQTLSELHGAGSGLIYETAEIYFAMREYTDCYKWLQRFIAKEPLDARGSLLMAQLLLCFDRRDDAVNFLNKLLNQKPDFPEERHYESLDKLIDRLKKILKAEKLLRRCPKLAAYEKIRRQMKRSLRQPADGGRDSGTLITQGEMQMNENQSAVSAGSYKLAKTIEHVWDMQRANDDDTAALLEAKAEKISECIFCQVLSYKKKLWLFNCIAGVFYYHDRLDAAVHLLRQALLLDDEDGLILKNLGYLLCKKGEYSAAKAALGDIGVKDFATQDLIRKCSDAVLK